MGAWILAHQWIFEVLKCGVLFYCGFASFKMGYFRGRLAEGREHLAMLKKFREAIEMDNELYLPNFTRVVKQEATRH